MTTEIEQHIKRGVELIKVADDLIHLDHWNDAVNRAYYAIFHAATAVLLSKGIQRNSHHALISAFGEFIAKPGIMNRKYHRYFINAFSQRSGSDYLPTPDLTMEEAEIALSQAQEFVDAAKILLKR